ncbi:MAG: NAD(P)-dependent oxidoreductase [Alphaproteobacteria bacterium]|nr:MAG: NAD(P)-dependent oxidoreductase [Alphaproteobacteria bacterium]
MPRSPRSVGRLVALTGASGFVGGHIAQALVAAGWQVRVLMRRPPSGPPLAALPVDVVSGSLADRGSLQRLVEGADAVVHVAGVVRARTRRAFFQVNADGVANLLAAVHATAGGGAMPHFLLLSSLAARAPAVSAYAASKRAGEDMLRARAGPVPWTILRPPVIYGPRDRNTLAFFRIIAKGIAPLPAPDAARVSCLHASDLAAAVCTLLTAAEAMSGQICEIDDGCAGGYSWRTMIETAAAHLGVRPRFVRIPAPLLNVVAAMAAGAGLVTGTAPILTPGKVREIRHLDWVCRDTRMQTHTAWRPRVPLDTGFARTVAWYRREKWL